MPITYKTKYDNLGITVSDAVEIIDGLVSFSEDSLVRNMEFDRRKLCVFTDSLRNLSRFLVEQLESAEKGEGQPL